MIAHAPFPFTQCSGIKIAIADRSTGHTAVTNPCLAQCHGLPSGATYYNFTFVVSVLVGEIIKHKK